MCVVAFIFLSNSHLDRSNELSLFELIITDSSMINIHVNSCANSFSALIHLPRIHPARFAVSPLRIHCRVVRIDRFSAYC